MLKLLILILIISTSAFAEAPDFSRRYGVSMAAGRNRPILGNRFDDRADGDFVYGLYGRYQFNRESGFQLGYTRYEWDHSPTAARVYDFVYLHRLAPRQYFTPIWGLGVGLVDVANYNVDENLKLGLKARIGAEFILSKDLLIDAVVDYQIVNKMIGEDDNLTIGEMHALAPQIILSYFFGDLKK